ncbi:hypothetical protein Trydic_g13664 [Trypoxylus dichotomus]
MCAKRARRGRGSCSNCLRGDERFSTARCVRMIFTLIFAFSLVGKAAMALKLTNMTTPVIADPREDMNLDCHFDMGKEELYAVKWYKDDHEFFR